MIAEILSEFSEKNDIALTCDMIKSFETYYKMLVEWNEKMNLTAITDERDVAVKHFCDCLYFLKYIDVKPEARIIDVGTGAGFPGLVLKIARPDISLCLMDSLNKRLIFLKAVTEELGLDGIDIVHSRAEDGVKLQGFAAGFDFATSRAVARMNILCEYCLPYVKKGGSFVALKANVDDELNESKRAIGILGGQLDRVFEFSLLDSKRTIVSVKKIKDTPKKYPRNSGQIKSKPL